MRTIDTNQPKGGLGVQDILFILFKHKWKILFFSLLGFAGSFAVYKTRVPLYVSDAKLLVDFVLKRSPFEVGGAKRDAAGSSGAPVINAEIEILTSQDLAMEVAEAIGVERLVPEADGSAELIDGARVVQDGLIVGADRGSTVVHVSYMNEDQDLSREVLDELIDRYFVKHLSIHRQVGKYGIVAEKIDQVRGRLAKAEDELKVLNEKAAAIALADNTESLRARRSTIREELMAAQTELAQQQARMDSFEDDLLDAKKAAPDQDKPLEKGGVAELVRYEALLERLKALNAHKLELLQVYVPGNRLVVLCQERIDAVESQRQAMAKEFPGLIAQAAARNGGSGEPKRDPGLEKALLASIQARIGTLKSQQAEIEKKFSDLADLESQIAVVDRRRTIEEEKYKYLEQSLEQARMDETLDPSKMPDIKYVQHPSAPVKTFSALTKKLMFGLAGAGVALGVGLALLLELVLDQRVMRPVELESRMHIPLMLSIPMVRRNAAARLPAPRNALMLRDENGEIMLPDVPAAQMDDPDAGEMNHFVLPYADAIRDRLFYYFELNDMTHKPKLVAVTGLAEGAGASTVAAGLATAFSQMGDSKVLLVDMNANHDEANPIFESKKPYSLMGALKAGRGVEFKENPENLYLASGVIENGTNGTHGSKGIAPRKLFDLMPVFRASEYDYIIFDMPPTGPTSPTFAMAGFMDQVLLVLDAQNTNRDTLRRTHSELVQGKAEVSCIFNKTRSHAPRWVQGEV